VSLKNNGVKFASYCKMQIHKYEPNIFTSKGEKSKYQSNLLEHKKGNKHGITRKKEDFVSMHP
jgi:hypothetical protein